MKTVKNGDYRYSVNLISSLNDGRLQCALSPLLAAKKIVEEVSGTIMAIYRVEFNMRELYQEREEGSYTGFDHLIVATPNYVIFFVDRGVGLNMLAACFGLEENTDTEVLKTPAMKYAAVVDDDALRNMVRIAYYTAQSYKDNTYEPHVQQIRKLRQLQQV